MSGVARSDYYVDRWKRARARMHEQLTAGVMAVTDAVEAAARYDGTAALVSVEYVMDYGGMKRRTAERHLATARKLGLIVKRSNGGGRSRRAAEYVLAIAGVAVDAEENRPSPATPERESGGSSRECSEGSPARDTRGHGGSSLHRQEGTPATSALTPATSEATPATAERESVHSPSSPSPKASVGLSGTDAAAEHVHQRLAGHGCTREEGRRVAVRKLAGRNIRSTAVGVLAAIPDDELLVVLRDIRPRRSTTLRPDEWCPVHPGQARHGCGQCQLDTKLPPHLATRREGAAPSHAPRADEECPDHMGEYRTSCADCVRGVTA